MLRMHTLTPTALSQVENLVYKIRFGSNIQIVVFKFSSSFQQSHYTSNDIIETLK